MTPGLTLAVCAVALAVAGWSDVAVAVAVAGAVLVEVGLAVAADRL